LAALRGKHRPPYGVEVILWAILTGIHGDDPVQVYKELGEVVQEVIDHFQQAAAPCRFRGRDR
jgi:hypothetical protein